MYGYSSLSLVLLWGHRFNNGTPSRVMSCEHTGSAPHSCQYGLNSKARLKEGLVRVHRLSSAGGLLGPSYQRRRTEGAFSVHCPITVAGGVRRVFTSTFPLSACPPRSFANIALYIHAHTRARAHAHTRTHNTHTNTHAHITPQHT